ncbi:MAG: hypothetical protein JW828_10010 [Sedimentisphaerales bacterium]|nr:hypothetical protein [Sedimentisphaerales bacterium]
MFELATYRCPHCGAEIRDKLSDGQEFACGMCHRQFRVLLDERTQKAGFVPMDPNTVQEPLGLPKGSVRAIATLVTAGCCWILIVLGRSVPGYVLSLLLTIIGYYFGFRQKIKTAESRILDASAQAQQPLYLPGGFIRVLLILGFGLSAIILYARDQLSQTAYLEFFLILAGLVAGYFFARVFAEASGGPAGNLINHVKGVLVLGATLSLAILLLGGRYIESPHTGLALACVISFYFGSRS